MGKGAGNVVRCFCASVVTAKTRSIRIIFCIIFTTFAPGFAPDPHRGFILGPRWETRPQTPNLPLPNLPTPGKIPAGAHAIQIGCGEIH